jgi:hypothetical protein
VFELRGGNDVEVIPTFDVMLGLRDQNVLVALGPALLARDVAAFNHWKLAVGARAPAFSRFMYFMLHGSLSLEDKVNGLDEGERVFVAVPAMGEAPAPALGTSKHPRFGVGLTLGLDLAGFVDGGDKLLKAIQGGSD